MNPELAPSVPAALTATAQRLPDKEAVVDGDIRLTYRELDDLATYVARALIARGIERGDKVAVWAQNSWQWCVAALGLQAAGAVLVPINTRFRGGEGADVIRRSGARLLFTTTGFLGADYPTMLREAAPDLVELPIVVMDGDAGHDVDWPSFLAGGSSVSVEAAADRRSEIGPDDLADIVYTSGSTGSPKGVVQTHGNVMLAMTSFTTARTITEADRALVIAPMFAQFGLRWIDAYVIVGATIVTQAVFEPTRMYELLATERITDFAGPPTLMAALLAPPAAAFDLSALRVGVIGSTSVPPELVRGLLDNKVFEHVFTAWGLTEACGPLTVTPAGADVDRIASSAGRPLAHVQLRVVKADGTVGGPGEEGELQALNPTNMVGYLGEPELTAQTLVDGGWLRTGDIGVIDADGWVQVTDRLKDMIIVGGFNVASAEVENKLRTHPAIAEAAVVAMPDKRLGEVPIAFVVARAGAVVDPDEVIAWSRAEMANFRVPRRVEVVERLPLNASLKVDKPLLRERAQAF